jgi:glycosyltransferase involved in cell wall biosynthesis
MYEDAPLFYNQMVAQAQAFFAYLHAGQPADRFDEFMAPVRHCTPAPMLDNTWTAGHASALIASGAREKQTLKRDYPQARFVTAYRLGSDLVHAYADGTQFLMHTGLRDFVLCVGRLESRKNQLMLLKALEDSDLPVVFATGGFTYQPRYAEACLAFKRRGKTVFLKRLNELDLAHAYAAARVHVLPSWYELPGIVSQEAAKRGTNVVVTDNGTARDYFGDAAFYCSPDDPRSVLASVEEAFDSAVQLGLVERVADCTWANAASRIMEIYQQVLDTN